MKTNVRIFLLVFSSFSLFAQEKKQLTNPETDAFINQLSANLQQTYFNAEKATELSTVLKQKLKKKELYNIPRDSLTKKLTLLLREKTNDIHFYVGQHVPEKEQPKQYFNGGFTEVKIMGHNIGYIKWDRCIADDAAFKKIKSALVFLEGVDYLIIDISTNPGGDGRSSGFINQHLYADPAYQNLLLKKCVGETSWYQSEVPYNYSDAPKFYSTPVYIITSGNTGSAAEYFAFIAQETGRATILGTTTAGAGNPVTMVTLDDFFVYIPVCEIKTQDGKSIEAKGVVPDVLLSSDNWLDETINYIIRQKNK